MGRGAKLGYSQETAGNETGGVQQTTPVQKLRNLSTHIKHSTIPKNHRADRFRCRGLRAALIGETEGLSGTGEGNNVDCSQR